MRLKLETLKSHKDAAQTLQKLLHQGNAQILDLEASIGVLQVGFFDSSCCCSSSSSSSSSY
jgi:hypothetical protein